MNRQLFRFSLIALLASLLVPFIASHKPLYIKSEGMHFFPAFSSREVFKAGNQTVDFRIDDLRFHDDVFAIYPPVVWSPGKTDLMNSYAGPFEKQYVAFNGETRELPLRFRHWLGTDGKGADVLAGLLHGFRQSMFTAFLAVLTAGLIGMLLGAVAGYFGNGKLQSFNYRYIAMIVSLLYFLFLIFNGVFTNFLSGLLAVLIIAVIYFLILYILKITGISFFQRKVNVPLDNAIMRLVEIMVSMPRLILILSLAAIMTTGWFTLPLLLGLTMWPEIIRFVRAQVMLIREQDYTTAAQALGFSHARILFNHVLRNGSGPVMTVLCLAFSNVILTEAGLAFIGIGMPADAVTWGSLLASGKNNFDAWWLIVFPGLAIFGVVMYLNRMADRHQLFMRSNITGTVS